MTSLHLTDRALSDIDAIDRFSVKRWGQCVAELMAHQIEAGNTEEK